MSSPEALRDRARRGFTNTRLHHWPRPELPPGFNWDRQIQLYCPEQYMFNTWDVALLPEKDCRDPHKFYRAMGSNNPYNIDAENFNTRSGVFCHRGFYDRAMKIPENSGAAVANGMAVGLRLHELDARLGKHPSQAYLAHDTWAGRMTAMARRFTSLSFRDIVKLDLVTRRFNLEKNGLASTYQRTEELVPDLKKLIELHDTAHPADNMHGAFQLDLRGDDFVRTLAYYRHRRFQGLQIFLKGYNLFFDSGKELKDAVASQSSPFDPEELDLFEQRLSKSFSMMIIVVFYSQPILNLALKAKGIVPTKASPEDRYNLSYEHLCHIARIHICSFLDVKIEKYFRIIPEIVHSGLGLGYNVETGKAINPEDGSAIIDPDIFLESRLDRAMIEVALKLRLIYPQMVSSSCTRLCDVRSPEGIEMVAKMDTGKLVERPKGEKGIGTRLRSIHGGLYPQSDMVVADDPLAEIAARTWIDEYAQLDRSLLLKMTYKKWLSQAPEDVQIAIEGLSRPFLPNTYDGTVQWDPEVGYKDALPLLPVWLWSQMKKLAFGDPSPQSNGQAESIFPDNDSLLS